MLSRRRTAPLAAPLTVAFAAPALAELATDLRPDAMEKLEAVASHLGDAERVQVNITTRTVIRAAMADHDESGTLELALSQPDRLRIEHAEGDHHQLVLVDGDHHYEYLSATGRYTRSAAPPGVRALFEQDPVADDGSTIMGQLRPMLQPLLSPRGLELFTRSYLVEAELRGSEELDGEPHHRLRLLVGDRYHDHDHLHWEIPIDLWIAAEGNPLPTRMVLDLAPMVGRQMMQAPEEAQIDVRFNDWRIGEAFVDDAEAMFAFEPPENAELAEAIYDAPAGAGDASGGIVGEPAPAFELEMLDGASMDLSRHRERGEIVILDFWATWCGPCIRAMPDLLSIQERYADDGVVLYAINVQEPAEHVVRFVERQEWDLRVPMDTNGDVARQYEVRGMPYSVLIGPDGTVQWVHLGFSPDLEQQFASRIDRLLEGESLVE